MQNKEILDVEKIIQKTLNYMGFSCQIEYEQEVTKQNTVEFNLITKEGSSFLIGKNGANLQALQHIVRVIAKKQLAEPVIFNLDVNSYKKEKNFSIIEKARTAAKQAIDQKRSVVLNPMSAYQRRIIHMELAENESVKTESLGEGDERKVVIKPVSEI